MESARDEAEDKVIYGESVMGIYPAEKDCYDPWQGQPHGGHYREIERCRSDASNIAEMEERARSVKNPLLHYHAAIAAVLRYRQLAAAYEALAAELKQEVDKSPVQW